MEVTEAVLGHVAGSRSGVVGVYQQHSYTEEARAALALWAGHVEALLRDGLEDIASLPAPI